MSLELGSRFRLPDGRLVEVVPDVEKILGMADTSGCYRCLYKLEAFTVCLSIGCTGGGSDPLFQGYPRILKEVEDEQTKG